MEENRVLEKSFQHLAPIEHPDKTGIYMQTLRQCIGHRDINNIAISGPYASGKSSIIKKYLSSEMGSEAPEKVLNISVADFRDTQSECQKNNAREDIELRVLQQILYTVTGVELPHSRFNRIKNRKRSLMVPTLFVIWVFVTLILALHPQILLNFRPWTSEFISVFLMVWYSVVGLIIGVDWLSQFFDTASFKKLSIKNLEFEREKEDQNSILSKYFDEILYFFEVQPYEVVIFEDLDRFGTATIYTKLHELNRLLNQNSGIDRHIQFIYAIKDSMFDANDRAKFFDFIIPVLPVTGPANAEDTFLRRNDNLLREEGGKKQNRTKVNPELLKSVAQFVTEPRIIHNTFNEYVVYCTAIQNRDIDNEQLFSLILYKNIFVHDFDDLHYGHGNLFTLVSDVETYKKNEKDRLNSEVKKYEQILADAHQEHLGSEEELLNLYVGALYRKGISAICQNRHYNEVSLSSLSSVDSLKKLLPQTAKSINVRCIPSNQISVMTLGVDTLQAELHPSQSIEQRIKAIQDKSQSQQKLVSDKLKKLNKQLSILETQKIKDLYASGNWISNRIDDLYSNEDNTQVYSWQNISLVKYLVRMGYLNENYYLYTTVFNNESHWTERDHRFFLKLQSRQDKAFDEPMDNCQEVYQRLNESEFSSPHIFNNELLTHALTNRITEVKTRKLLDTVIEYYHEAGSDFLLQYLSTDNCQDALAMALTKRWPEYLEMVFDKNPTGTEARWLVGHLDASYIDTIPSHQLLLEVLSRKTSVFIIDDASETAQNALGIIERFKLEVADLPPLEKTPIALKNIVKNALFVISPEAIHFVLVYFSDATEDEASKSTYHKLLHSKLSTVIERVDKEINHYISTVMLPNPNNTQESEEAILSIINNSGLEDKLRGAVIGKQEHVFDSLQHVAYGADLFFKHRKVNPSWELLEDFHQSERIDIDDFLYFINDSNVIETLTNENIISTDIKISNSLKQMLLNADEFTDDLYITLASFLITEEITSLPELNDTKLAGLIKYNKISLNERTFEKISHLPLCVAMLLDSDAEAYIAHKEQYPELGNEDISAIIKMAKSTQLTKCALVDLPKHDIDKIDVKPERLSELYLSLSNKEQNTEVLANLIQRCSDSDTLRRLFYQHMATTSEDKYLEMLHENRESLSKTHIRIALSVLPDGPLRHLLDNSKRPSFSNTPQNKQILDLLVRLEVLVDYSVDGSRLRVRKYRNWTSG
ncbi:putative membrane protein YobI [Alteromonas sp. KUL150]|uniref:YobI family P-loop NTPase n=1 Tax=Alteromonas sp. KUL150 TaxID=2480805 RepID=UPI0012E5DE1F|nr:hypothetical protein [Alteromonas sp. KUL150]GFD86161.1 putative membrane protein YobI [Alteromonas sp. KUL150]